VAGSPDYPVPMKGAADQRVIHRTFEQLVFCYYAVLNELVPRLLVEKFGKELPDVESYYGHIEIVRDGVLEVVSFPTPQAVLSSRGYVYHD
jgi:hypothetical protein